ncbi:hypothetical protein BDZ89DRAFT_1070015 [Hymenopellis radicata]|nr:hypothetical protein BDZ89DRAFT_1070015 [Hymenopellis radicata]
MTFWGLCYYHQRSIFSLPLLQVTAVASIKELGAQVKLIQKFVSDATVPIEAVYSFPVPARAAVCGFAMVRQDGTQIKGLVKEKMEARKVYDNALAEGKTASLATQQTADVFQVSVGNLLPKEEVQIELVYATDLTEDEGNDSIRLLLPAHIGCRYGQAPTSLNYNASPFINVSVDVEALSPIRKIGSPSHSISTELGPDSSLPGAQDLPFANYARVTLASDAPFQKDFVLTIQSAGLDAPRCVAELHPEHDSVAMALTLVPRFNLPEPTSQEFIFLVDRSGSMGGKRITAARKALVVMLRSLPHQSTAFQIVSFGSTSSMLWPDGSMSYNQETLDEATKDVDNMGADYGGTEIGDALSACFRARKTDRPTNVIVLTDGDAWDNEAVFQTVKDAVGSAPNNAYLRVFCLGIGNSASTAMCEGIARAGNGASIMVGEDEASITGKIARLLKAARTPRISNVRVDWGRATTTPRSNEEEDFEMVDKVEEDSSCHDMNAAEEERTKKKRKLNIFDESADVVHVDDAAPPPPLPIDLLPPAEVQQSPVTIDNLGPGFRLYVYAILQGKATLPKVVTIRGATDDGADIELPVPVTLSNLPNDASGAPPAIHALAARKIIQDFEDGRYSDVLKASHPEADLRRVVKAHIVRLGKTHCIGSSQTSFVAVDEESYNRKKGRASKFLDVEGEVSSDEDVVTPEDPVQMPIPLPVPQSVPRRGRRTKQTARQSTGGKAPRKQLAVRADATETTTKVDMDVLEALARSQSFDGSFSMKVLNIVKDGLMDDLAKAAFPDGTSECVVATALVLAYISAKLAGDGSEEKVAWEGIYQKAHDFLVSDLGAEAVDEVVKKATELL